MDQTPVFSTLSGDTGPHVSPPDRRRDPSAIMGTVFRTSQRGQRKPLVRATIGISAPFTARSLVSRGMETLRTIVRSE